MYWTGWSDTCPFQSWNWCMIPLSSHTSNLELQIGVLNGNAYQHYKTGPFELWQTKGIMRTRNLFSKFQVKDIFDVQCLKFWYKFVNNKLPNYFRDMFEFNHELHDIETRNHDRLHLYPTRTSGARNVLRHHIPELLNKLSQYLIHWIKTHSVYSFSHQIKCYLVDLYSYECNDINCYVCNYSREWQIAKAETVYYDFPVITGYTCSLLSHNDKRRRR